MSYSNCQFTWLNQTETFVYFAESLLKDETYFDCQLFAEGHRFNVHRVILSCNSPILCNILKEHNSELPVITLEGVSSIEVAALVEFMYTGTAKIPPQYLKNFFQLARSLQLAGLTYKDSAQINKIINESGSSFVGEADPQEGDESYGQNILKYLDETESNGVSSEEAKEIAPLDGASVESIFINELAEESAAENCGEVIFEKYDADYAKEESNIETLESNLANNDEMSPQTCETGKLRLFSVKKRTQPMVEVNAIEENETETPIVFNKYHNVLIKNENNSISINDGITTVYSISKLEDLDERGDDDVGGDEDVDDDFSELHEDLKVTEEDENFFYVKLEGNSFVNAVENPSGKESKVQTLAKRDFSQIGADKCLRVINPLVKNSLEKRQRNQNSQNPRDSKSGADDKKIYICLKCGNKYSHRRTLLHHIHWICEQPATYSCSLCPYRGKRKFQLKSHMKHAHLLKMSQWF